MGSKRRPVGDSPVPTRLTAGLIATENVDLVWPLVVEKIEAAIARGDGEYRSGDVLVNLRAGRAQLWLGHDETLKIKMIAVTRIEVWPAVKRFRVDILSGEGLTEWLPVLPVLESWAKDWGCEEIVGNVRPGMGKRLVEEMGFKLGSQTVSRRIK